MLAPCRLHVGSMLVPCWLHVGSMSAPCWLQACSMSAPCRLWDALWLGIWPFFCFTIESCRVKQGHILMQSLSPEFNLSIPLSGLAVCRCVGSTIQFPISPSQVQCLSPDIGAGRVPLYGPKKLQHAPFQRL